MRVPFGSIAPGNCAPALGHPANVRGGAAKLRFGAGRTASRRRFPNKRSPRDGDLRPHVGNSPARANRVQCCRGGADPGRWRRSCAAFGVRTVYAATPEIGQAHSLTPEPTTVALTFM